MINAEMNREFHIYAQLSKLAMFNILISTHPHTRKCKFIFYILLTFRKAGNHACLIF